MNYCAEINWFNKNNNNHVSYPNMICTPIRKSINVHIGNNYLIRPFEAFLWWGAGG